MTEKSLPLVSTIIAVYNGEAYLEETTESAITQTYRNIEIIIIDDDSTDGSRNIAQRRLHRKNHGTVNRDKSIDYVRILRATLHRHRQNLH